MRSSHFRVGFLAVVMVLFASSSALAELETDPFDCMQDRTAYCLALASGGGHMSNLFWRTCETHQEVACGCHEKLAAKRWMGGYGLPDIGHICPWADCFCTNLPAGSDKDGMCGFKKACDAQKAEAKIIK